MPGDFEPHSRVRGEPRDLLWLKGSLGRAWPHLGAEGGPLPPMPVPGYCLWGAIKHPSTLP